jgi:hypothetical protein
MSGTGDPPARPRRRRRRRTAGTWLLAACLAGLLVYLLLPGGRSPGQQAAACDGSDAPDVGMVAPAALSPLRDSLARVLPQRLGRLYEEGTVSTSAAWLDSEPSQPPVLASAPRPDSYEMRWWAPNGDDVGADVFVFASAARARRFLALAAAPGCRDRASAHLAVRPPLARAISWLNPEGVAEGDIYLVRGTRVYRIADVPSGQAGNGAAALTRIPFATLEVLACQLPGAQCASESQNVPA